VCTTLAALAEPSRLRILRLVWQQERPAGDIAAHFDVTFGAISQHLRVLHEAGLVEVRRAGRQRLYRARREVMGPLADYLEAQWRTHLESLKDLAQAEEQRDEH
jgi:DNA-binding transcriptional ArsR family regulator